MSARHPRMAHSSATPPGRRPVSRAAIAPRIRSQGIGRTCSRSRATWPGCPGCRCPVECTAACRSGCSSSGARSTRPPCSGRPAPTRRPPTGTQGGRRLGEARYQAVIGLECHVQLQTRSKIFSGSSAAFGAPPNTEIDPVCLGLPGVLPVLNRRAVELALRLALATGCQIRTRSRFARKHYFYPDLPKGFQISQYEEPLAERGAVELLWRGEKRRARLTRIHLEDDAGKSLHAAGTGNVSLLDFNRAGVPLAEVVSEPDLRAAEEAGEFLRALRQLVRY